MPEEITDASGQTYMVTYNGFGQPTVITNPLSQTRTLDYSTTGLLIREIANDPASYAEYAYDSYDRVTSVTYFPDVYTMRYEYDLGDRLTKVIYPDGTYEEQVYNKLDVIASRDRAGRWTQMRYTLLGQLASVTNPAGETIQYDWCACGSPSRIVDAKGRITAYTMDMAGRLVKEELPDLSTTTYTYEPKSGRLATKTDAKGQVTHYAYAQDNSIWKTWVTNVASGTASVPEVEYAWDRYFKRLVGWRDNFDTTTLTYVPYNPGDSVYGDGKLYSTKNPIGNDIITRVYDKLGRTLGKSIDGDKYYTLAQYDSDGRVTSTTNNLGTFEIDYAPHTNRPTFMGMGDFTTYLGYSGIDKNLDSIYHYHLVSSEEREFAYYYDIPEQRVSEVRDSSNNLSYVYDFKYDNSDQLAGAELWHRFTIDPPVLEFWKMDSAGNRTNYQKDSNGSTQRQKYTVNDADQLVSVRSGGPIHVSGSVNEQAKIETGLSPAPVLTEPDGSFSAWIYAEDLDWTAFSVKDFKGNATGQGVSIFYSDAKGYDFEYDTNGNRTRMIVTDEDGVTTSQISYEWDAKNQLVAINMGTLRSEFTYDGMGRRIRIKEIENSVTQSDRFYLWDGLTIIASSPWSSAGITGADKLYFSQGFVADGNLYYYTKDRLGSIMSVLDASGNLIGRIDYDSYGTPNVTDYGGGMGKVDFLYTGHFYHRPSGLYLAPYRAYDSQFGRWLSREPLGLDGPNAYHYGFNDPMNGIDKYGLFWSLPEVVVGGVAGGLIGGFFGGLGGLAGGAAGGLFFCETATCVRDSAIGGLFTGAISGGTIGVLGGAGIGAVASGDPIMAGLITGAIGGGTAAIYSDLAENWGIAPGDCPPNVK